MLIGGTPGVVKGCIFVRGDWFCALVSVPIREITMVISLPLELYILTKHGSVESEWIALLSPNSTAPPPTTQTP